MSISPLRLVTPPRTWDEIGEPDRVGTAGPPEVAARGRSRRRLARVLLLGDVLATVTACASTAVVLALAPALGAGGSLASHKVFLAAAGPLVVAVLAARGSYSVARRRLTPGVADELLSLVAGVATAGVLVLAGGAIAGVSNQVPPAGVGLLVATAAVLLPMARGLALAVAAHDRTKVTRVIVVGSGRVAGELAHRLGRSRLVEVVGTVDDEPAGSLDVLGSVDELPKLCRALDADRVVIAFSKRHPSRSAELVLALRDVVEVDVVVRYFELAGWESRLHDVAGLSLLHLGGRPGVVSAGVKRLLDVVVAATGLLLLSPLLAVVAAGVWVESGEPILFRQIRVGRGGRTFRILKFRTMTDGAPAGVASTASTARGATAARRAGATRTPVPFADRTPFDAPDPSRITGMGRLLRRTGLDELPQLINVLRGEMSLVGPRPLVPEECGSLLGWAHRRFDVRPGITGMWQVCGQHEVSLDELCRLDVQYATSWSIRTDLRILARTPSRLLHGSAPGR